LEPLLLTVLQPSARTHTHNLLPASSVISSISTTRRRSQKMGKMACRDVAKKWTAGCAVLCTLLLNAHGFCPPIQTACALRARAEDHGALCGGGILGPHACTGEPRLRMCSRAAHKVDDAGAEGISGLHPELLRMHARELATRRRLLARLSSWAAVVGCAFASAAQGESDDCLENVLVIPLQDCGGTYALRISKNTFLMCEQLLDVYVFCVHACTCVGCILMVA
jgi:hypothetical protein